MDTFPNQLRHVAKCLFNSLAQLHPATFPLGPLKEREACLIVIQVGQTLDPLQTLINYDIDAKDIAVEFSKDSAIVDAVSGYVTNDEIDFIVHIFLNELRKNYEFDKFSFEKLTPDDI
jgi:hypothetical protein